MFVNDVVPDEEEQHPVATTHTLPRLGSVSLRTTRPKICLNRACGKTFVPSPSHRGGKCAACKKQAVRQNKARRDAGDT
jgi:hypothetical protein